MALSVTVSLLAAQASSASALANPAAAMRQSTVVCARRHGHTIARDESARIFKSRSPEGTVVYGCVQGGSKLVRLWQEGPAPQGPAGLVKLLTGRFAAIETITSNQYEHSQTIAVFDLRSGSNYEISRASEPIDQPPKQSPLRVEKYVLGRDGRTAILYERAPTGQLLELIGFHKFSRPLASTPVGEIPPSSLTFTGKTVSWIQHGRKRSASV